MAENFRPVTAYPDQNLLNPGFQWFAIMLNALSVSETLEASDREPRKLIVAAAAT
jgi:hypothetical protein